MACIHTKYLLGKTKQGLECDRGIINFKIFSIITFIKMNFDFLCNNLILKYFIFTVLLLLFSQDPINSSAHGHLFRNLNLELSISYNGLKSIICSSPFLNLIFIFIRCHFPFYGCIWLHFYIYTKQF